jgi:hypothetical protein
MLSDETAVNIALMMEAARTSETSVYFDEITRFHFDGGCHLRTCLCENLKPHIG